MKSHGGIYWILPCHFTRSHHSGFLEAPKISYLPSLSTHSSLRSLVPDPQLYPSVLCQSTWVVHSTLPRVGKSTSLPVHHVIKRNNLSIRKFWFMRSSHFMVLPAMALNFCLNLGLAVTLMPSVMSSTQWLMSASLFSLVPRYQACQGRTVNWLCLPQSCTSFFSLSGNTYSFKRQS